VPLIAVAAEEPIKMLEAETGRQKRTPKIGPGVKVESAPA